MFRSLKTLAEDLWKSLVLLKYKEKEVSSFGMWNSPQRKATKDHSGGRHLQVDRGLRAFGSPCASREKRYSLENTGTLKFEGSN